MAQTEKMSLAEALAFLDRVRRRYILKLALIRCFWMGFTLCILSFYLDALLQFSDNGRLTILVGSVLGVIVTGLVTYKWINSSADRKKMLARLIESEHLELNNDLVNAIDFEEKLQTGAAKNVSAELMQKSVEVAVNKFDRVEGIESLEPRTFQKERRLLYCVFIVWLAAGIGFYNWFATELPRYFDPFGDHPPYSATKFVVNPAGVIVDYGDDLQVNVEAKGKIPKEVTLVMKNQQGALINEAPMFNSGEGKFFQTIEKIHSEMIYYARIQKGRSKYYEIALSKIPRIESTQVSYRYPEYTKLSEKTRVLAEPVLKAYRGTQVTMTIESNRPLKAGTVTVGDKKYEGVAEGKNTVDVTFPMTEDANFVAGVIDIEDNISKQRLEGRIKIVPDDKPTISIVSPGMNSFAIPTAEVPVVMEAYDDLGIRTIGFLRSHNDSDDSRKVLWDDNMGDRFIREVSTFNLADLGVRPGDTIDYYATATDAFPDAPQTTASESFKLKIISEEEYAEFMQSQMDAKDLRQKYDEMIAAFDELAEQQRQLEEQTRELREKLQQDPNAAESEAMKNKLDEMAQRQAELAEKTQSLSEKFAKEASNPPVFDIEKDYKKTLSEWAKSLEKAKDYMEKSAEQIRESTKPSQNCSKCMGGANENQQKALAEMGQQQESKDNIQQANREIEKMIDLMSDVEMFKQLYLAQKGLARQAKSLKNVAQPSFDERVRLKELAEQENLIKDSLNLLKEKLREDAAKIQDEYPKVAGDARSIANEIEDRYISEIMQESQASMNEGSGKRGYPKAKEAADQMEEMISFCKGAAGKGGQQCEFRLKIQMSLEPGNTMGQLSQNMGSGAGMGQMGALGRGSSGFSGGQSNFAMYGNETFGRNMQQKSLPAGDKRIDMETLKEQEPPDPLSGNIEELASQTKNELEIEAKGDSRMMAEYSRFIEAYFQRLAEDK